MSDLKKYISKRKKVDKEFAEDYDKGFENFRIGVILRQARKSQGSPRKRLPESCKQINPLFPGLKIIPKTFASPPFENMPKR